MTTDEGSEAPVEETPPAVDAGEPDYPKESYAWYVVGVLMLVYVSSFVDRQILSMMVIPIRADLDISEVQMGFLMGPGFAIFYAVFGFPLGRLADTRSRRTIIAIGLAVWSFMTAGCGIAKNYTQFLMLRIGVGVGEASLSPSAYSLITDYFRPNRLATAISAYGAGIYIGSGMAFLLGATVIGFASGQDMYTLPLVGEIRPWQLVFLVIGGPGLLFTAVVYTIREPIRRGMGKAGSATVDAIPMSTVLAYIRDNWKTFSCHTVGFAFLSFIGYSSAAWGITFYARVHEWDPVKIGLVYGTIVVIFGTAGILFGGRLADRLADKGYTDSKMRTGLIAAVLQLPFGAAVMLVPEAWMAFVIMIPATFFLAMPFGVAPAAIQEMMPNAMRGQASALYLFIVNLIGLAAGPLTVAWFTQSVFKDDNMVWASLLVTGLGAGVIAITLLAVGLKHFRNSIVHRDKLHAAN